MIELVLDSETINTINQEYGGTVGGAFDKKVIKKFLDEHSRTEKERADAQVLMLLKYIVLMCASKHFHV